jgi:NtrC-family two-component system sensor histidine kinase KinB
MVLKTKLSLGLGFLFLIIFAMAFLCSYYVEKLSEQADNILKDNYNSIVYAKNMFSALDDMLIAVNRGIFNASENKRIADYDLQLFETGRTAFEKNLKAENGNITEIHEKEYVDELNNNFAIFLNLANQVKQGLGTPSMYYNQILPNYERIKQFVNNISDLNMETVERKSQVTHRQANNMIIHICTIATLCIILAFVYFWYFPLYISGTLAYLAERMTALVKKMGIAYDFTTRDEANVILQSIDLLENKLGVSDTPKGSV